MYHFCSVSSISLICLQSEMKASGLTVFVSFSPWIHFRVLIMEPIQPIAQLFHLSTRNVAEILYPTAKIFPDQDVTNHVICPHWQQMVLICCVWYFFERWYLGYQYHNNRVFSHPLSLRSFTTKLPSSSYVRIDQDEIQVCS